MLENDTSSTSSTPGHSTVSTALLATEFPAGLLSDSTDSDSCSDYTIHPSSDSDEDSDWEDAREDSGAPRFQLAELSCAYIVERFQESTYSKAP